MKRTAAVLLILGFGLLPIWAASAFVYYGSLLPSAGSEYWNAAPWLIVFAIPVSVVTLAAALTIIVFGRTSGDDARKWRFALLTFALSVVAIVAVGGALWAFYQDRQGQGERAVAFVLASALAGGAPTARLVWTQQRTGSPTRYGVAVTGMTTVYAVVDVAGWFDAGEFSLACVTRENRRDVRGSDPCVGTRLD